MLREGATLFWLVCLFLGIARVEGGFQYPHDVMVKDEETGAHQRRRRQKQQNPSPANAKPGNLRHLMGMKSYSMMSQHHMMNNYYKGYYNKGKGTSYHKGKGHGHGFMMSNDRTNFRCSAGGALPSPSGANARQCPYPMLDSRDAQFEKTSIVNGLTYDDLAEQHARWLFDRDDYDTTSPVFDVDGSLNEQDSGVSGVHFLSPNGQATACMTTAVSRNDLIFFDVSTSIFVSFPSDTEDDWYGPLRSYARFAGYPDPMALSHDEVTVTAARLTASFQQNLEMNVYLDGCPLNPRHDYAVTDSFVLSDINSFGCGTTAAAGGFYGAVGPLSVGTHFLRVVVRNQGINYASDPALFTTQQGDVNTFESDNVFRLIVT